MDKQVIIDKFLEEKDLKEHELVYWKHKVSNGFKLKKFMEDFIDYYNKQLTTPRVIGSAYKHGMVFRCSVCGKFILYSEIDKNEIKVEYTPDTEYTVEEMVFTHLHCL